VGGGQSIIHRLPFFPGVVGAYPREKRGVNVLGLLVRA